VSNWPSYFCYGRNTADSDDLMIRRSRSIRRWNSNNDHRYKPAANYHFWVLRGLLSFDFYVRFFFLNFGWSLSETRESKTNMGGGDRIVLTSKPNYLRILHTWSILSTKREVEMVVGPVFIPFVRIQKVVQSPLRRPCHLQEVQEGGAVGDGCDGRAWVLEALLQLIARAGKVSPRRAWLLVGGPLEGFLRPMLPGPFWAFTFKRDKSRGLKAER